VGVDLGTGKVPGATVARARATPRLLGVLWPVAVAAAAVVLISILAPQNGAFLVTVITTAAIYTLLAFSISGLYTFLGAISLGVSGFAAIGAYTLVVAQEHGLSLLPSEALAILLPAAVSALAAPIFFRLRGIYFVMITFAFAALIVQLAIGWTQVTEGVIGLSYYPQEGPIPGLAAGTSQTLTVSVAAVALAWLGFRAFRRSNRGRRGVAIGNNETLAASLGVNARTYELGLSALAGGLGGLAGILYVFSTGFIVPSNFSVGLSLAALTAVIVGGVRSVAAPILGGILVIFLPRLLSLGAFTSAIVYAALLIGVMLLAPGGLVEIWEGLRSRLAPTRPPAVGE
jgi:branched-chain amino acid transport system permease protein